MPSLPHQLSLHMDPDDRLVAAVGGAARYMADAAGLGNTIILQFQASVVSACQYCFRCHTLPVPCAITLRRSLDRLEIEVALQGREPPATERPSWEGIDEVHCESRDHQAILHLIKFVPPRPSED